MYLLEHDAKELLAQHGIAVPAGRLIGRDETIDRRALPAGPWIVKGQIAAGGRGKAGLIRRAETLQDVTGHANAILGATVNGRTVEAVRIEQAVAGADEAYLGLMLDATAGGVRVVLSAQGGVDVEALLIEINPLFIRPDGSWVAGDAKFVTDDSALPRQPELGELLGRRAAAYPEAALKLEHGFDYVVVDPAGEIGLLTTGAGLSMMLIDELRAAGLKPYNFLDIRTGGLRGETKRLAQALQWIGTGSNVKVLLVNIFAGITDLGEFSRLLVAALGEAQPGIPVVARLVGNGLPVARELLSAAGIGLHTDLNAALAEVRAHLASPSPITHHSSPWL